MATTNLLNILSNDIKIQTGNGTPDHVSPIGSIYVDLDNGLSYSNTNGVSDWGSMGGLDPDDEAKLAKVNFGVATGTNTYALTTTPATTSYEINQLFHVIFNNANTAAATLNVNGLGAVAIKRNGDKATKANDIRAGQAFTLMYDGTDFQIVGRVTTDWRPTALTLGDGVANGATLSLNAGAGIYVNFDASSDDEYLYNISLPRNGVPYDGSDIVFEIEWMKFGASGGTVIWELDYAFVNDDDDAYSKLDGTESITINVGPVPNQEKRKDIFTAISGATGADTLQLTLRRNSAGGGSDTYTGEAEMYGFNPL